MRKSWICRLLIVLLLLCMSFSCMAESYSAVVMSGGAKVYSDALGSRYLGKLKKKTIVTVLSQESGIAQIEYKGARGYALLSNLTAVDSFAKKAIVNTNTKVFAKPSTKSRSVKLAKGTKLYVLATSGSAAMVELNGNVGYVYTKHLNIEGMPAQETQAPEVQEGAAQQDVQSSPEPKKMSIEEVFASGKYTNEELCYQFAVHVMGYNEAAAAGIVANISAESGFRTNAVGDSGASFGICQWYSARRTRLLNWCEKNGRDASQLLSQLYFLQYELEKFYPSVHRYLNGVEDSAEGAYDAGYYFCYNFEGPTNRAEKSTKRAEKAQNTFYPRHATA